jgi:hypothetical protein
MRCGTADVAGVAALPEPEAGAMAAMAAMASACHLMKWLQHECVSHVSHDVSRISQITNQVMCNAIQPKMHKNATKTKKLKTCPEVSQAADKPRPGHMFPLPCQRPLEHQNG